jgi:two-component system CheB/CheR fusion protein
MRLGQRSLATAFAVVALLIVASIVAIYLNGQHNRRQRLKLEAITAAQADLEQTLSTLKDAETGQRGYLLTNDEAYLGPYHSAIAVINDRLNELDQHVAAGDMDGAGMAELKDLTRKKLDSLEETIRLNQDQGPPAALSRMRAGLGKNIMDDIRALCAKMNNTLKTDAEIAQQKVDLNTSRRTTIYFALVAVNLAFLFWAYRRLSREMERSARLTEMTEHQKELLAVTLASIGDAVIVTDTDGRITFINEVAIRLTGWSERQAIGALLSQVFPIIDESTRQPVENPAQKVMRQGVVVGLANHTLLIRKDGTELPIDDSGAPIRGPDGTIFGVVLVFRDFSQQKEHERALQISEQRLRLAVTGADLGTFSRDVASGRMDWDRKMRENFWLPDEVPITRELFFRTLHPDDRQRIHEAVERAMNEHGIYDQEYRVVSSAGEMRWLRSIGRFEYDAAGKPTRLDGITINVTDRKKAEDQIKLAMQEAEQANRAKDHFLAALSHELRTPLTPVLAMLATWEHRHMLSDEMQDDVRLIRRNVELEARLIDDLLDLTRAVKGKLPLNIETVDMNELTGQVADICQSEINAKHIQLRINLAAQRHHIMGDQARLQQVLWNILRNATKFSGHGNAIEVETSNTPTGQMRIRVTDHGIGMDEETLTRIFRPFEQGTADITRKFGGLGLGLAISKALVDAQGGTLAAESNGLDQGSTFLLEFPAVQEDIAATVKRPAARRIADPGVASLRILLVEDHEDTARTMRRLLETLGYRVEVAPTSAAAIQQLRAGVFDILLSDIGLPDGNGIDLIRKIRQFSQIPAIALTGFGMDEDIARCRAAGFNAHMTKPVNFERLEMAIHQIASRQTTGSV